MNVSRIATIALAFSAFSALPAAAQVAPTRLTVEGKTSLAWWQVDPHYEHLWATTCPAEPSWQPGEGRDPGLYTDYGTRPVMVAAGRSDSRVPLFPRYRVRPVCRQAVHGEIVVSDTATLRGVRGVVSVIADSLFTGLEMRDKYARRVVFETSRFPEFVFTIDSLVDVQRGDTIRAIAVGSLAVHGGQVAVRAPVTAVKDPAGLRVRAQFAVPAPTLVNEFMMSKWALSMGVVMKRWKTLHMGVDVILRPAGS
jgi:hypothetical protein